MGNVKCSQCGASFIGLVCEYCGTVVGMLESIEDQKRALDEYHKLLRISDKKKQINLLMIVLSVWYFSSSRQFVC